MNMVLKLFGAVCLWWLVGGLSAFAQSDLHADLTAILEDSSVMGAGIVVIENGAPSTEVYWGLASAADETPVIAETRFRAGSISKNLTSLMAVRLTERGALDLNAVVTDLAPEIAIDNRWSETDPVRVVHLLEHTAGLPGSSYREYSENRPDATPADYIETVGEVDIRWRPGTLYSYSNAGHTLLARLMEVVTGEDFDDLAQELVFDPLGMESASFLTYGTAPERLARSYTTDGRDEPVWEMLIRPSGSLVTSPRDLARLVALYASNDGAIVSQDAIARMQRSEASAAADAGVGGAAYGFGTFAFLVEDTIFRGHWGKTEGFRANMGYVTGAGAGFVIMLNTVDEGAAAALRARIAEHLSQGPGAVPAPQLAVVEAEELAASEGHYVIATHEQPMRAWLFKSLDQRRITSTEDGLQVAGMGIMAPPARLFRPVESGGFIAEGFPLATAASVELDSNRFWIDGDAYVRVSPLEATFRRIVVPAALIVSLIAIVHAAIWGMMGLLGRGPRGDGLWTRAALLVSGVGFAGTALLFVNFGLLGGWAQLSAIGQPTLVSIAMAILSVLGVLGALAAAGLTIRRAVSAPGVFLVWEVPASTILASFAILWILAGWFPLVSWGW